MKDKKTSELIDLANSEEDKIAEKALEELDSRYPFDWIDDKFNELDKLAIQVNKLSERFDKIDSFWNIANKLDMILDRLPKKKGEYHRQEKKP